MRSIRHNLLLTLMGTMFIALVLGAAATYRASVEQANALLDYHLRQFALGLVYNNFDDAPGRALRPMTVPSTTQSRSGTTTASYCTSRTRSTSFQTVPS